MTKTISLAIAAFAFFCSTASAKPRAWAGTIAKIGSDGRVYINAGSSSGLRPGAQLVVHRDGEAITDPKTHQVLGHELGRTAAVMELESHLGERLSVCSVVRGGRGLRIGDPVALDHSADDGNQDDEAAEEAPPPRPTAAPAAKPAKPVAAKAAPPKAAAPPSRPSETTPKNGKCQPGKFMNAATANHCCWPEQLWSDRAKACIGAPRCPNGFQKRGLECEQRTRQQDPPDDSTDE